MRESDCLAASGQSLKHSKDGADTLKYVTSLRLQPAQKLFKSTAQELMLSAPLTQKAHQWRRYTPDVHPPCLRRSCCWPGGPRALRLLQRSAACPGPGPRPPAPLPGAPAARGLSRPERCPPGPAVTKRHAVIRMTDARDHTALQYQSQPTLPCQAWPAPLATSLDCSRWK